MIDFNFFNLKGFEFLTLNGIKFLNLFFLELENVISQFYVIYIVAILSLKSCYAYGVS
jgi:hypothetical protein